MVLIEVVNAISGFRINELRKEFFTLLSQLEVKLRKELGRASANTHSAKYESINTAILRIERLRQQYKTTASDIYLTVKDVLPVYKEYCRSNA